MKYCGYEIGKDITCEQMERLFNYLHANYTKEELLEMNDETLHRRAEESQSEWR